MGFELRRLALFETECNRKDGEIVSLRNEIADLRSILSKKEDEFHRYALWHFWHMKTPKYYYDEILLSCDKILSCGVIEMSKKKERC